jgi:hypothetical protein
MHDFVPRSIKLSQQDPLDPTRQTQVLVSLAHIVRLVPRYYVEGDGKRMVTRDPPDAGAEPEQGLRRSFEIFDDLGGRFESHTASDRAQEMLERLWNESA